MTKSAYTPMQQALCKLLAEMRAEAGLSQRALAEQLGVPHSWVAKVELGERRLDVVEFVWVCEACGVKPADVLRQLTSGTKRGGCGRAQ